MCARATLSWSGETLAGRGRALWQRVPERRVRAGDGGCGSLTTGSVDAPVSPRASNEYSAEADQFAYPERVIRVEATQMCKRGGLPFQAGRPGGYRAKTPFTGAPRATPVGGRSTR